MQQSDGGVISHGLAIIWHFVYLATGGADTDLEQSYLISTVSSAKIALLTRFWQSLHAPMISGGLESARKIELFPLNMFQWGFDPTKPVPEKWHSVSILMMGWASVTWTFYRPQYMYSMELIHIWHCDWPYHECEYQWWWLGYVKVVIYTYSQGLWKDILILDGPRVTLFSEW